MFGPVVSAMPSAIRAKAIRAAVVGIGLFSQQRGRPRG